MNDRERGLMALNHQEPDHVPMDFGGRHTTVHLYAHQALMRHLGFSGPEPHIRNYHTMLVEPDPQLIQRFERVSQVFFPNSPSSFNFHIDQESGTYYDEWGVKYLMPPGGFYYDMHENPLANAETEADLNAYRFPDPTDPSRIAGLAEKVKAAHDAGEKLVIVAAPFGGLMEQTWYLLGLEQSYIQTAANPRFMESLADRLTEWLIAYWDMTLDVVGPYIDVIPYQEDLGSQSGPLISPSSFRRIYKPRMRRLLDSMRKKTNARIYMHSCGSVRWAIPDMIECGVEALNPVQVSAFDMDSSALKRDFGKDITFWGGGCDPVVLQNGTPAQVADEVERRIQDLAPGGGFIFGSVHNIQANVPPENIVAFYDAARKYGGYPVND
ncbi:MAG TPA: uroporphyrinogen decarboxylase family protein [Chloroflexota bacterium]